MSRFPLWIAITWLVAVAAAGLAGAIGGKSIWLAAVTAASVGVTAIAVWHASRDIEASFSGVSIDDHVVTSDTATLQSYRALRADVVAMLEAETVTDLHWLRIAQDRTLEASLRIGTARLSNSAQVPVELVVAEHVDNGLVTRRSTGHPGLRIPPRLSSTDADLDPVLARYSRFHYRAEFSIGGRSFSLIALSDVALGPATMLLVESAASEYQSSSELFYLAEHHMLEST
jgi:hypothetical protein